MRLYKLQPEKPKSGLLSYNDPLFRSVFDESPDAIFLLDPENFEIIDCNTKAVQLFQADERSELYGRESFSLYDSKPVEFSKNLFIGTIMSGKEHTQELALRSLKGNVFWGKISIRMVEAIFGSLIIFRVSRVIDYMKTTEMLSSIIRQTSRTTGHEFFKLLTQLLVENLNISMSFVARIDREYNTATTLNIWHKSNKIQEVTFNLLTGPSFNVLKGYATFYPSNLNEMFPEDIFIAKYGMESYMGTPIFDSDGKVSGLLVIMDDKLMDEIPNSRYMLSLFASRAGAEMSRIDVEENYKRKIRELQGIVGKR
jgi:PAS domain S-box-containing protein